MQLATSQEITHLFQTSSINLLVWERRPGRRRGQETSTSQTASPPLSPTHPFFQLLMAEGSAESLSPGHQGHVPTPTPRHPASNDRSVGEFKGLLSRWIIQKAVLTSEHPGGLAEAFVLNPNTLSHRCCSGEHPPPPGRTIHLLCTHLRIYFLGI